MRINAYSCLYGHTLFGKIGRLRGTRRENVAPDRPVLCLLCRPLGDRRCRPQPRLRARLSPQRRMRSVTSARLMPGELSAATARAAARDHEPEVRAPACSGLATGRSGTPQRGYLCGRVAWPRSGGLVVPSCCDNCASSSGLAGWAGGEDSAEWHQRSSGSSGVPD